MQKYFYGRFEVTFQKFLDPKSCARLSETNQFFKQKLTKLLNYILREQTYYQYLNLYQKDNTLTFQHY